MIFFLILFEDIRFWTVPLQTPCRCNEGWYRDLYLMIYQGFFLSHIFLIIRLVLVPDVFYSCSRLKKPALVVLFYAFANMFGSCYFRFSYLSKVAARFDFNSDRFQWYCFRSSKFKKLNVLFLIYLCCWKLSACDLWMWLTIPVSFISKLQVFYTFFSQSERS